MKSGLAWIIFTLFIIAINANNFHLRIPNMIEKFARSFGLDDNEIDQDDVAIKDDRTPLSTKIKVEIQPRAKKATFLKPEDLNNES